MKQSILISSISITLLVCALGVGVAASAASLALCDLPASARQTETYSCEGGKEFEVSYWNTANGQSFALVPVDGTPHLLVNTVAASGVKYQAGRYTWWTRRMRADLYDVTVGENAPPVIADCVTQH
jgi:membrane-bound inhibitor of C-type lysozyme